MQAIVYFIALSILLPAHSFAAFDTTKTESTTQQPSTNAQEIQSNKLENIEGKVVEVQEDTSSSQSNGKHVKLKTPNEEIDIVVGPNWFIEQQNLKIGKGDTLKITGFRITTNRNPMMVASEITKNGKLFKFRDSNTGVPLWQGKKMIHQENR